MASAGRSISDPLARLPRIEMAYHIPPGNTPDNYAAGELAVILGQGQSSRMYQHLVKEKQLASQVNVQADCANRPQPVLRFRDAAAGREGRGPRKGNRR